jgi:WD40 repeat protein
LWNVADPARPTALGPALTGSTGNVASVAFSPDMRTLATGSFDSLVRLQTLDVNNAVQRICATTTNTLTPAQWKAVHLSTGVQPAVHPPKSLRTPNSLIPIGRHAASQGEGVRIRDN